MLPLSSKPYLAKGMWLWCVDQGLTPYLSAKVDGARVPKGYDRDGEIVLNLNPEAVNGLTFEPEGIGFQARFSGQVFDVWIPSENIVALFAKETGHGIALPNEMFTAEEPEGSSPPPTPAPSAGGFKRVK
ncbi:ClpXP protease specificity-enhancing factor [Hydrogenophilus islandicus]